MTVTIICIQLVQASDIKYPKYLEYIPGLILHRVMGKILHFILYLELHGINKGRCLIIEASSTNYPKKNYTGMR